MHILSQKEAVNIRHVSMSVASIKYRKYATTNIYTNKITQKLARKIKKHYLCTAKTNKVPWPSG